MLFPLSVIEGPIITILAGFLASLGFVDIFLAYLVVVAGDLCGDMLWYSCGRWGLKRLAGRWGRFAGLTPERLVRLEEHFGKHSGKTLLVGKVTCGVGALALVGAGAAKMRTSRFLFFNLVGTMPKSLALLVVGYFFGRAYTQASSVLNYVTLGTVAMVMLGIAAYIISRKSRAERAVQPVPAS